jgi:hypothetical protein
MSKATEAKSETKRELKPMGLVGRCFHIFDADGCIRHQGIVRGDLGDGRYLVQYFEWLIGEPGTLEIRYVTEMRPGRTEGAWQFYEDCEHMKYWFENYGKRHEPKEAA